MRRLPILALLAVCACALAPAGSDARTCKKFKEQRGCRLPNPSGYASTGNIFTITISRKASDVNGRFSVACTGGDQPPGSIEVEWPIDEKLNFPGRPRIGVTYDVGSITDNNSGPDLAGYEWKGELRVTSAKKVSQKLSFSSVSGKADNPRRCEGSATKTLRRVKYL